MNQPMYPHAVHYYNIASSMQYEDNGLISLAPEGVYLTTASGNTQTLIPWHRVTSVELRPRIIKCRICGNVQNSAPHTRPNGHSFRPDNES